MSEYFFSPISLFICSSVLDDKRKKKKRKRDDDSDDDLGINFHTLIYRCDVSLISALRIT